MVGFKIDLRFGLLIFGVFENDVQNALHSGIEHLDIERAVVDRVNDLLVVCGVFTGHFKLHAGFKALYAVCGGRAPVAHHVAVKAPLIAENIGQQALIFSGERTVDAVIRAHNRPRLRVLYGSLKRRKVNFAQGAFINDAVAGHAVVFLTVGSEMLHADADILALHAIYVVFGKLAGEVRVFGKILKIAATERRTLDVDGRAEQNRKVLRLAGVAKHFTGAAEQLAVE